jgi:iron complex transport system substrate-binding protein
VTAPTSIVSLVPAATEIIGALGLLDRLTGISHECDFPPEVSRKPRVTRCEIHEVQLSSAERDRWVSQSLSATGTLYTLDEELVRALKPDLILTQQLCDVCAVGYDSVAMFAATMHRQPEVIHLDPVSLTDILDNIRAVAAACGVKARGEDVIADLERRVEHVRSGARQADRLTRCFLMEWLDPPYSTGHWGPELVSIAGGREVLGTPRQKSMRVPWESVLAADPEVILIACCGYTVARTLSEIDTLRARPGWQNLAAVRDRRVYVADGTAYFSRPGPRVVDSLEILAAVLHPSRFPAEWAEARDVVNVDPARM